MLSHTMKRAWHLMVLFCFLFLLSFPLFPLHANAMSVPRICVVDTRRSSDAASLMSSIRKNGGTPVLVTTKKKIRAASYDGLALPGLLRRDPVPKHRKESPDETDEGFCDPHQRAVPHARSHCHTAPCAPSVYQTARQWFDRHTVLD